MSRSETLGTRVGEFRDLLNAKAVMNGTAKTIHKMSYQETMRLE